MAGDFQNSNNKTKTHSDQKNLICHQNARHLSFLCDQKRRRRQIKPIHSINNKIQSFAS